MMKNFSNSTATRSDLRINPAERAFGLADPDDFFC